MKHEAWCNHRKEWRYFSGDISAMINSAWKDAMTTHSVPYNHHGDEDEGKKVCMYVIKRMKSERGLVGEG